MVLSVHGYVGGTPELGKPDTGGQVVFVLELAKQLVEQGYEVDIVTRRFEQQPEYDRIDDGLQVWRIPFGGDAFIRKEDMHDHLDEMIRHLLSRIDEREISYDLVSSHYWDAGWVGQTAAEQLRIPHVHTPHSLGAWKQDTMEGDPDHLEEQYRFAERIRKEFLTYQRSDHVIVTSTEQFDFLEERYEVDPRHMTMIPPGIDETRYTPVPHSEQESIRRRLGFQEHDVYAVGRAAANKGYDLLIHSLPALRDHIPDARLQLAIGANSKRDEAKVDDHREEARQLGVADLITWHGYIPDEEMADYYRAAGAFALPSRYEPFGMTAVEAMACGTPAIVTVHGGLHEQIGFGEHALFADPRRPGEWAAITAMVFRHERLRERLATLGARFARREFGWRGIARRTSEVFERLREAYAAAAADHAGEGLR
jgi:mannosylfructose-phosphate synthase